MKLVDSRTMALIDSRAQKEFAIPGYLLMENAGIKAFEAFTRSIADTPGRPSLLLFAGKGNNGGDALVMARQAFLQGHRCKVVLLGGDAAGDAEIHRNIVDRYGIPIIDWEQFSAKAYQDLTSFDYIIDGLFGTGLRGGLREEAAKIVEVINSAESPVVSIDVPSGLGDDYRSGFPVVHADHTLCLGLPKQCLFTYSGRMFCGKLHYVAIGFPPPLVQDPDIPGNLLMETDIKKLISPLPPHAYKNSRGKVAIFAGSPGTTGASILCSYASARSRAGTVSLFLDKQIYHSLVSRFVSIMPIQWDPESDPHSLDLSPFSAFVAGPGWGFQNRTPWLLRLLSSDMPGVLDADALTIISQNSGGMSLRENIIVTPHPGEFRKMSGVTQDELADNTLQQVLRFSAERNCIVVFKSHITIIANPAGKHWVVDGLNPAMGTGGTGDILSGIIGGLLANGETAETAACLGVLVHKAIGRLAYKKQGMFVAEDLLPYISFVFAQGEGRERGE